MTTATLPPKTTAASQPKLNVPSPFKTEEAAQWFVDKGFGVFPVWGATPDGVCLCPKGASCTSAHGKHPASAKGFKDAGESTAFLKSKRTPNYGIVPKAGTFIVDVDGEGIETYAKLDLPDTLTVQTPSGGTHRYFEGDALVAAAIRNKGFVVRMSADVGEHVGYVVGPRSRIGAAEYTLLREHGLKFTKLNGEHVVSLTMEGLKSGPSATSAPKSRYEVIRDFQGTPYNEGLDEAEIRRRVHAEVAPTFAERLTPAEVDERFDRAWKTLAERFGPPVSDTKIKLTGFDNADTETVEENTAAAWPEPLHEDAYHGVAGSIVRAMEPYTEADPAAMLLGTLVIAGVVMGPGAETTFAAGDHGTKLFVVVVGDTALSRKGTAFAAASLIFKDAHPNWRKLTVPGLGSGEGLIMRLKDSEPETRALVREGEFGRLLTAMTRESSTLSSILRDTWDGVELGRTVARQSDRATISDHHVGIMADITALELSQKLASVEAANGFGNRFLWVAVKRSRIVSRPPDLTGLVSPFVGSMKSALDAAIARPAGFVPLTAAGEVCWDEWYLPGEASPPVGMTGALTRRRASQAARLALIYALLDKASAIDVVHLKAAFAVVEYVQRSVVYVFGDSTGDIHADALRKLLREEGQVDWKTLKGELGLRYAAEVNGVVNVLVGLGLATVLTVKRTGVTKGRARRVVRKTNAT